MTHQFPAGHFSQIDWRAGFETLAPDFVNAAVGLVPAIGSGLMARVLVVPVNDEDGAVRSPAHVDGPKILVAGDEKIRSMAGDVRGAVGPEHVAVDRAAV